MKWAIWVEDNTLPEGNEQRRQMIGVADVTIADNLYRVALEEMPVVRLQFGFTVVEFTNVDREERAIRAHEFSQRTGIDP